MLFSGERARGHLGRIVGERFTHDFAHIGIAFHELRSEVAEHAEHILVHKNLAVATSACANADGRNRNGIGDHLGKRRRDSLDDNCKRACLFNGLGVGEQSTGGFLAFALHLEAAKHVD